MKKFIIYLFCIVLPFGLNAQIITLFAGGGSGGDGSQATSASLADPSAMVFDKYGNLYFTETLGNKVRKIDTNEIITTIAGTGRVGFSGDGGLATGAEIDEPNSVAIDSFGNIYFADVANNRIREIDVATGIISTIAGNMSAYGGVGSYGGDGGPATLSSMNLPQYVCFDKKWNLYIADYANNRVRKINTSGIISTIAGNGTLGATGDGGPATAAEMEPSALCFDNNGNLYIGENGLSLIKKMDTSGIITAYAGDSSLYMYNGDGIPATAAHFDVGYMAVNALGLLYFTDVINYRVRMIDSSGIIHTAACDGVDGYSGDGGPADSAETSNAVGIAFDHCDNLYFSDVNHNRIRKVTYSGPGIPISITISAPAAAKIDSAVTVTASITGGCCSMADSITWYNSGVAFATTTTTTVTYTKTNNIDSITARAVGCGDSSVSGVDVVGVDTVKTGVALAPVLSELMVYPNPAHTLLHIVSGQPIDNVVVSDVVAREVYSGKESVIDVSKWVSGVYFVKVNGVMVERFLKE